MWLWFFGFGWNVLIVLVLDHSIWVPHEVNNTQHGSISCLWTSFPTGTANATSYVLNSREWWLATKRACQWWFRLNPRPCLGLSQNASNFQWSITIFPGIIPIEVLWTGVVYSSLPTYFRVKRTPFHMTPFPPFRSSPGPLRRSSSSSRPFKKDSGSRPCHYWQKWRGSFNGYNGLIQGKTLEGTMRKGCFKMYPLNMCGSCKCSLQPILGFWEAINLMQPTNCREDL